MATRRGIEIGFGRLWSARGPGRPRRAARAFGLLLAARGTAGSSGGPYPDYCSGIRLMTCGERPAHFVAPFRYFGGHTVDFSTTRLPIQLKERRFGGLSTGFSSFTLPLNCQFKILKGAETQDPGSSVSAPFTISIFCFASSQEPKNPC